MSSRTPRSLEYDASSEDLPASDCHRPGHGFKERLLPSSYRILPRRRAYRAHASLFEWTNVGCLQPCCLRAPLSSALLSSSPSSSSSVCLFFCGGLGVGEKPTRGELVRSTHRVPSPFISSQRFPFETFRVYHGILWGWQQLMALSSPLCIIRLC